MRPDVAATVAEAIDSLSTWLAPSPVISVDPLGYLFAELRRAGFLEGWSPEQQEEAKAVTHYHMREILGYSLVDPLLRDPELEDVSCEGPGRPVKVWHKRYNAHGWLESNVLFRDQDELNSIVGGTNDRAQGVILQQQHSARRDPGRALGEGPVLVRGVHQAETVEDDVSLPAGAGWYEAAGGEQLQPGPAVRAAVLGHHALVRQETRRGDSFHGRSGLSDERGRLGASRFLGHGGIGQQLGQATR